MNPAAFVPLRLRPLFGKHTHYERWWPGVLAKKREARKQRKDNWTRAMLRGLFRRKTDAEMGVVSL